MTRSHPENFLLDMTPYPVLLLPLLALAMAVFLPLSTKDATLSTSLKSRRRRKILLGRLTVIVLLVATLATLIWPIVNLNSLVQGVIFSALILVPAYLVHWIVGLFFNRPGLEVRRQDDLVLPLVQPAVKDARKTDRPVPKPAPAPVIDLTQASTGERATVGTGPSDTISLHQRKAPVRPNDNKRVSAASPAEVQEQLDRVAELVQSHDLGESNVTASDDKDAWDSIRQTHDRQSALSTNLISADVSHTDVAQLSLSEVTQLVTHLRKDKTRLQKLVIAQQAAIESERQAQDRSRLVARDAVKIMRDSRNAQKLAEKIARRERTERQRIEIQYKKVAHALDNALSIIESKKQADTTPA